MLNCVMCNKRLEVWFEGECCSDKCRKKKSRDKLQASPRAHKISFEIEALCKTMRVTNMSHDDARELMHVIWRSLDKMIIQVQALENKEEGA